MWCDVVVEKWVGDLWEGWVFFGFVFDFEEVCVVVVDGLGDFEVCCYLVWVCLGVFIEWIVVGCLVVVGCFVEVVELVDYGCGVEYYVVGVG